MKLSVIIPIYNEADTIEETLARVAAVDVPKEVIAVDDCSTDGTLDLLERASGITLIRHDRNRGKGSAIRTGLARASGEIVIVQDADLEYDPADIPAIIAPIVRGEAEAVYGSRFLRGRPKMRRRNYLGNRVLAIAANLLFRAGLTDEATCYKAFRTELLKSIPLTCRRFEFCPEVTAKLMRRGVRIAEVPVSYSARTVAEGKKITTWDGVVALWTLLKFRVRG